MANVDEARELVKRLVREQLAEKAGVNTIVYHGEEIGVTMEEDRKMRLTLPRLRKSYVVMSGRVYERDYVEGDAGGAGEAIEAVNEDQQPRIMTQLNYMGEQEQIDAALFCNRVICGCGNVRFVKNADIFQVTKCKPCTIRDRKARRRKDRTG